MPSRVLVWGWGGRGGCVCLHRRVQLSSEHECGWDGLYGVLRGGVSRWLLLRRFDAARGMPRGIVWHWRRLFHVGRIMPAVQRGQLRIDRARCGGKHCRGLHGGMHRGFLLSSWIHERDPDGLRGWCFLFGRRRAGPPSLRAGLFLRVGVDDRDASALQRMRGWRNVRERLGRCFVLCSMCCGVCVRRGCRTRGVHELRFRVDVRWRSCRRFVPHDVSCGLLLPAEHCDDCVRCREVRRDHWRYVILGVRCVHRDSGRVLSCRLDDGCGCIVPEWILLCGRGRRQGRKVVCFWDDAEHGISYAFEFYVRRCCVHVVCRWLLLPCWHCSAPMPCRQLCECDGFDVSGGVCCVHRSSGIVLRLCFDVRRGDHVSARVLLYEWHCCPRGLRVRRWE